jgi:hypothetical protein
VAELGGAGGLKANVLVPSTSLMAGTLVQKTYVNAGTQGGRSITAPVYSQVHSSLISGYYELSGYDEW